MFDKMTNNLLAQIIVNTQDKIALKHSELTLSAIAQAPDFTGLVLDDVYLIEIRVRAVGSPADSGQIARITFVNGDTPTATHGMYLGDGDLYTVTNKFNVENLKIISADGLAHVANLVFYGA